MSGSATNFFSDNGGHMYPPEETKAAEFVSTCWLHEYTSLYFMITLIVCSFGNPNAWLLVDSITAVYLGLLNLVLPDLEYSYRQFYIIQVSALVLLTDGLYRFYYSNRSWIRIPKDQTVVCRFICARILCSVVIMVMAVWLMTCKTTPVGPISICVSGSMCTAGTCKLRQKHIIFVFLGSGMWIGSSLIQWYVSRVTDPLFGLIQWYVNRATEPLLGLIQWYVSRYDGRV